jgi:predicted porin
MAACCLAAVPGGLAATENQTERNMKNRIAVACAAVLASLAAGAQAQSSVQLTGMIDVFAGSLRAPGDAGRTSVVDSGGMTTSWYGFKGTEDLGSGYKASFALTAFLRADAGQSGRFNTDPYFSRDANVTLSTPAAGSLTVGRGLAPNFLPTILFNPFGDSFTFSPLVLHKNISLFNGTGWAGTTAADTGWSNELIYSSPSFGGLTANVHYQFGEQAGTNGPHNVGANLLYFAGPFAATAYFERDDIANPTPALFAGGDTKREWMLGASYEFSFAKFYATYGRAKADVAIPRERTWTAGASVPLGGGSVLAGLAHSRVNGGATRRTVSVGYDYNLSKSTDVYAMAMHDSITSFSSGNSFGLGIRKKF